MYDKAMLRCPLEHINGSRIDWFRGEESLKSQTNILMIKELSKKDFGEYRCQQLNGGSIEKSSVFLLKSGN